MIQSDTELVETVAHARSGLALNPGVDVIIDVGGQYIKRSFQNNRSKPLPEAEKLRKNVLEYPRKQAKGLLHIEPEVLAILVE